MPVLGAYPDRLQDQGDVLFATPARGQIVYRGASFWQNLPPGTAGQLLSTNGAGADPSWVTPAAPTLDGLTDVNVPTVAQGDILYRNATEWVRLVAGTAGTLLTTGGAGANPSWATLAHSALTGLTLGDPHTQYALADKSRPSPWVAAADLSGRSLADLGTRTHALLTGLAADDHTLYALADKSRPSPWVSAADLSGRSLADLGTRTLDNLSDVNLPTASQGDILYRNATEWVRLVAGTSGQSLRTNGAGADPSWVTPVTAHSALSGLSADDHTQYALLAGRSGGQTLSGGTGAGENLTIQSTASATKGKILFSASSAYDGANNRLGIGTASPLYAMDVRSPNPGGSSDVIVGSYGSGTGGSDAQFVFGYTVTGGVVQQNFLKSANNKPIRFVTSTIASALHINDDGQVAVGLTAAAAQLDVALASSTRIGIQIKQMAGQTEAPFVIKNVNNGRTAWIDPTGNLMFYRVTTVSDGQPCGSITSLYAVATHATFQGRTLVNAHDWNGTREGLRVEANGTVALVSTHGVAAVARQTVNAAAVDAATTMALCNQLRAALIAFGPCQ